MVQSLDEIIDKPFYKKYIDSLNSMFFDQEISMYEKIIRILRNNNYLYQCGVEDNGEYGIGIVMPAPWESEVIGKDCAKIFVFNGTNYSICNEIVEFLHKRMANNIYWVQYDSQLSEPHVEIALENFGYHIGTQYYQWVGNKNNLNMEMINFADRFETHIATKEHAQELKLFTEKFPEPGRYVADPFLGKNGKKLYASWAYNSCIGKKKSEQILICKEKDKIIGYETISIIDNKHANLGILRIDSKYKGQLLGYGILVSAIKFCIEKDIKIIKTRTSKFNVDVNKIYKNLGFSISDSSIQFHWVNNTK